MKKLLTITVLMALAMSGFAQNQYDFSAVCESGQTLYYRITDAEAHTVILTHPYRQEGNPWFEGDYYEGFVKPEGETIIPSVVTYNDTNYTVTAIDSNSFWECIITSVFMPNTVNYIAPRALGACVFLESISMEEGNPTYYSESNTIIRREDNALVVGCKTSTIPEGIEIICQQAIYAMDYSGVLTIPNSVRIIENGAFAYNRFSGSLALPESLETLGSMAFYASGFSGSLTMPNSVTEIGHHAFYGCRFSGSLTLSSSLSTIENCAFADCQFSGTLVIPNSVNLIVGAAFSGNNFSELVLGESVATIESIAFLDCNNLTGALRLPASLTQIDQLAFKNTSFNEIYSPNRMPPTLNTTDLYPFAFDGYDTSTPIHIPFGCTEAYQNAEGWNYFTNFIEEEPIIFTDFEPDLCVSSLDYPNCFYDTIKIDFDQNGITDFKMYLSWRSTGEITIDMLSSWELRFKLSDNDLIVPSEEGWHIANYPIQYLFMDTTHLEDMIGFRTIINGDYYFAWSKVYADIQHTSTHDKVWANVDSIAFCTIPNYPLRWGQTSLDGIGVEGAEWYYEILNDDGTITYQHLECVGDTLFDRGKRPKVIVRSNTHYNRTETEVTHEYVYEENGVVYWWNRDLQEFTTLYNLNANVGDEWEIKVGTESLTMHVDAVENYEYEGRTYRMLHVSDPNDLFSGDIVCGIGHLTSFFPERLMNRGKGYRVEGMRCYWVDGELVFKYGDRDCDEVYEQLHNGIEDSPSAVSGTFVVYPNPTNGILTIHHSAFSIPNSEFRITNLMGQTLLQGNITTETQHINIESLAAGMYFITFAGETQKFVVR